MTVKIGYCIHAGAGVDGRFRGRDHRIQIAVVSVEKFAKVVEAIARRPALALVQTRNIIRSELEISVMAESAVDQIHLLRSAGKCRVLFCKWTSETIAIIGRMLST